MTYQILTDDGQPMDAHAEADADGITLHSRGGSSRRGTVQNAEYGPALRLLLRRLATSNISFDRAWVDSTEAQRFSLEERTILRNGELDADGSSAFTLMSNRMKAVGQDAKRTGGKPQIGQACSRSNPLPGQPHCVRGDREDPVVASG
jgi:hypothetical protein